MAQQGEAAPGLCGSASERPTGFWGASERGREGGRERERASHPSLTAVCFLFAVEREADKPFFRDGWGVEEEDKHEKPPPFAVASLIFQFAYKNLRSENHYLLLKTIAYLNKVSRIQIRTFSLV